MQKFNVGDRVKATEKLCESLGMRGIDAGRMGTVVNVEHLNGSMHCNGSQLMRVEFDNWTEGWGTNCSSWNCEEDEIERATTIELTRSEVLAICKRLCTGDSAAKHKAQALWIRATGCSTAEAEMFVARGGVEYVELAIGEDAYDIRGKLCGTVIGKHGDFYWLRDWSLAQPYTCTKGSVSRKPS